MATGDDELALSPALLQEAAGRFGMLAATTRLHIVWVLAHGEQDVSSLAEQVDGTVAAVSQHLAKLKLAGLVRARREGRHQFYEVDDPSVAAIVREMVSHLRDPASGQGGEAATSGRARGLGA
ncbi:ArsR/SmtB family transcription factor [Actinomadura barringtoniae]|uniref:ArsR/SmtB family transcription factor n=1 Tax=Actinomadura barringtoniae TaxID=1427535 RepID=UPI001FB7BC47|nr:metalloregulator ArsR/SmtB family transcription factor [Actinomadura barringtoniae]